MKKQIHTRRPFYRRKLFFWTVGSIAGVIIFILLAFRVSPWPGAMIIRYVFDKGDAKTTQALEKYKPAVAVASITNQQYRKNDTAAFLDVYFPAAIKRTDQKLPLVIWTHGGAWVSGGKSDNATYYKLLAAQGFTVISVDYSLGPEKTYPTAINQLNDMYAYVQRNAERFHVDSNKIVLAGDSAGSQISSQMAALITNPTYAAEMHISPNLKRSQLRGVILNCGIYKMEKLIQPNPTLPKIVGWGDDVSVWAYVGKRGSAADATLRQMSTYYHVTDAFPSTYISGGNADPLTNVQSKPLADKLESMGVAVTRLFYDDSHKPSLPHEYQFNLDTADGKRALSDTISYLKAVTK